MFNFETEKSGRIEFAKKNIYMNKLHDSLTSLSIISLSIIINKKQDFQPLFLKGLSKNN